MKLAVVVQRYGAEINGGAEQHARYIAEHLSRHAEVEVLTTCARDYVTWRNEYPPGASTVNGVLVRRFPVRTERNVRTFGLRSAAVFDRTHSPSDELAWLEAEGPTCPALIRRVSAVQRDVDFFLFFSYRYYHAYHGVRAVPARAVLVPTAERDSAIGLAIFAPVFQRARAIMYNSFEERDLIHAVSGNQSVPGVVVGVGSEVPAHTDPERFRQRYGLPGRYALYIGRIDANKGCRELFICFEQYARASRNGLSLVLVGRSILPIPDHPRIRHVGFVPDQDKFDALAGAEALIMPSYLESLSMVVLEAWALGKPVVVNARCDVLRGQCRRSNAGLFYGTESEFVEILRTLDAGEGLRRALGANGRAYFARHYAWPVIEGKYLEMLERLSREPAAEVAARSSPWPLPGRRERRIRSIPPSADVLARVPDGPSQSEES